MMKIAGALACLMLATSGALSNAAPPAAATGHVVPQDGTYTDKSPGSWAAATLVQIKDGQIQSWQTKGGRIANYVGLVRPGEAIRGRNSGKELCTVRETTISSFTLDCVDPANGNAVVLAFVKK